MMEHQRRICRLLHDEHLATLELWGTVQHFLGTRREAEFTALLPRCRAALAQEITRHFAFEEEALFPRLAEAGEADIVALLEEEHQAIRGAGDEFSALAAQHAGGAVDPGLRALALELAERLFSHVQKEEMGLLPMLDDLLDDETDEALTVAYSSG